MNNKLLYRSAAAILFLAGVLAAYIYSLLFFPPTIIEAYAQPYPVLTPVVHPGGSLTYVPQYCKYLPTRATVARSFVGTLVYALPPATNNLPAGCNKETVTIQVPAMLPPGTYHLQLDITYQVNFLRSVTYQFTTQAFRVTH